MTIRTRRKIFYSLVAIFILVGGGVVFYAQGWRLDFTTWHFEKVGGIYIRAYPQNVAIYLNGDPVTNESGFLSPGTLISDLLPRSYSVVLKAPGYNTWRENTTVVPSLVSQFTYAVLIPQNGVPASTSLVTSIARLVSPMNGIATGAVSNLSSTAIAAPTGTDPFNAGVKIIVSKNIISTYEIVQQITTASATIAGKNADIGWITGSTAGILQNDGQLYLYSTGGDLQKIADDVKAFAATVDGSRIAALEDTSLEILSPGDSSMYYRFNIPDIAHAQKVIWYRDRTHLFIVYPDHVSFLDLNDTSLVNFATVAFGTDPVYDAQGDYLYLKNNQGQFLRYDFSM